MGGESHPTTPRGARRIYTYLNQISNMLEKRHVQIITDVLKELAGAGIDKLAAAYLPVETEKRKRTSRRGKKNRKTNITKDTSSRNIE